MLASYALVALLGSVAAVPSGLGDPNFHLPAPPGKVVSSTGRTPPALHRNAAAEDGVAGFSCGPISFVQNVNPEVIELLNTPACTLPDLVTLGNGYARVFVAPSSLRLDCVRFGIAANTAPWHATVRVLLGDASSQPYESLSVLSATSVELSGAFPQIITVPLEGSVNVDAGTAFTVEIEIPSRAQADGGDGGSTFFGGNNDGQSQTAYIRALQCGVFEYIPLAAIGFPESQPIIAATGTPLPSTTCPGVGDCLAVHSTPGCADLNCCNAVCAIDFFCCTVEWDVNCVDTAFSGVCSSPIGCQNPSTFVCEGGCDDNFAGAIEPSEPSAALIAAGNGCEGSPPTAFDEVINNHCFKTTLGGCWPHCEDGCGSQTCGTIVKATLEMRLKATGDLPQNDTLSLRDGAIGVWGASISSLIGSSWDLGDIATITLDLNNLPGAIPGAVIASMCDGEIDFTMQDDTSIDYLKLTIEWCPCEFPFRPFYEYDDSFDFSTPTPTHPSAELLATAVCSSGALTQYDTIPCNQCFVETITGYDTCAFNAYLTIGLRQSDTFDCYNVNDGISLEVINSCEGTFRWSASFASLEAGGYISPALSSGNTAVLSLNLGDLPPDGDGTRSILSDLLDGSLDIRIQDDTGVDFINFATDSCSCKTLNPYGACCFTSGVTGVLSCVQTDAATCETQLHGTWYGPGTSCDTIECAPACLTPPSQMRLWLPLDEPNGTLANDIAWNNDGTLVGGTSHIAAKVANGAHFDGANDVITVPDSFALDIGTLDLSIDLWARTSAAEGIQPLVDKRAGLIGSTVGYTMFLLDGKLSFQLADGLGSPTHSNWVSTAFVADGNWHHLAVTVDRDLATGGVFYVDGAAVGTFNPTGRQGSLANAAQLWVGERQPINSVLWYAGDLDEIEIFARVLGSAEVKALFEVGSLGKCKTNCCATWDQVISKNLDVLTQVSGTVCNNTPFTRTFGWSALPSTAGSNCNLTGSLSFFPPTGTITVGPGECKVITTNVQLPPTALGSQTGCFTITFVDQASGESCEADGTVIVANDPIIITPCDPVIFVPATQPTQIGFDVSVLPGSLTNLTFVFQAFDCVDMFETAPISINGLPIGVPYVTDVRLVPGSTILVDFPVQFLEPSPLRFYDVILQADLDGNGIAEALASIGLMNVPEEELACVGDLDGNGVVDSADLAVLLGGWGPGTTGDINGDGIVDASDLAALLGAWGACP